jgi:hypothetical protein
MEFAIPIIALGGLFIISNQDKTKCKENFENNSLNNTPNYYNNIPRVNKHFSAPTSSPEVKQEYTDLAGRTMKIDEQTVNLRPFFGKTKNIGNNSKANDGRDSTLDNYTGSGSTQITKSENAPLFKPQDNIQHAYGMPNQTEFIQSRQNPSTNMHNVKPFQEQRVAPGMNQGFSSEGSGGFNSGMEARTEWLPKTVDELRVLTNPKTSYELANHQGPAINKITNTGIIGKVEKYLPDKYYVNDPARYLTTTGAEKGPTLRSIQPAPTIHRATTTKEYAGIQSNTGPQKEPQRGLYRIDTRQQLEAQHLNPATTTVERSNLNSVAQSIEFLPNNRTTTQPETFNIMSGLVSAITAPITDILRPTRKEHYGLTRFVGVGSSVPNNTSVRTDKVASTIREDTTYSPYTKGQRAYKPVTVGGYQVASDQPIANQRQDTSVFYSGIPGSIMPQQQSNIAEYNSTISSTRGNEGRIAGGNTQRFTPIINQTCSDQKSVTHLPYTGMAASIVSNVPNASQFSGRNIQSYENTDRNNPTLLESLKQNPYMHSITNNM